MTHLSRLSTRPARAEDMPRLWPLYAMSFAGDELSERCFPRTASSAAWWTAANTKEFTDPCAHYLLVEDQSPPPGTRDPLVAYAKWNEPLRDVATGAPIAAGGGDDADAMLTEQWPQGSDAALAQRVFGELARRRQTLMGGRPHWYLEIVATLPHYRRRGIAGELVQWGVDRADRDGVQAYLEAGPAGYYERWGFAVVDSFKPEGLERDVESLMVRKPKGSARSSVGESNG